MNTSLRTLFVFSCLFLTACDWTQSKAPNVVVIAADLLASSEVNCTDELGSATNAFSRLCEESVRFTHAYTSSILAQPALASVITGLYPMEHGLRHNGAMALSAEHKTLAELALAQGYRTAFFSGGAPVFRKSGLDQGFEVFEDNITPSRILPYRPLSENINFFENWVRDLQGEPFFSMFYVPDLRFTQTETNDNLGEARNLSYASQLLELDESLQDLVGFLKAKGQWENTIFVLVGLNGQTSSVHRDELSPLNLYSDNSQVALLIKPQRKVRDLGLKWKIDRNVALPDIGHTLAEAMGLSWQRSHGHEDVLEKVSLQKALKGSDPDWDSERLILTESAWAAWHHLGPIRWAARKGLWLYLHNQKPQLFNTLIDRMELVPSSMTDPTVRELAFEMMKFFDQNQLSQWPGLSVGLKDKFYIANQRWLPTYSEYNPVRAIELLHKQGVGDEQLRYWWAELLIEAKKWNQLLKLAQKYKVSEWEKLAQAHLSTKEVSFSDPCLSTLNENIDASESMRLCDDRLFLMLREWIMARNGTEEKEVARERFLRHYRIQLLDEYLAQLNFAFGGLWDMDLSMANGPSAIDITLALPEHKRYRQITRLRLEE